MESPSPVPFPVPFVVKKGLAQAPNFTMRQLEEAYALLVDTDWTIKTGGMEGELALDLLVGPVLDCLITDESPFEALPTVLARLADAPGESICHRIFYP